MTRSEPNSKTQSRKIKTKERISKHINSRSNRMVRNVLSKPHDNLDAGKSSNEADKRACETAEKTTARGCTEVIKVV